MLGLGLAKSNSFLFNTGDANATLAEVIEARIAVDTAVNEAKIALELAKAIQVQASNNTDHISGLIEVHCEEPIKVVFYFNRVVAKSSVFYCVHIISSA